MDRDGETFNFKVGCSALHLNETSIGKLILILCHFVFQTGIDTYPYPHAHTHTRNGLVGSRRCALWIVRGRNKINDGLNRSNVNWSFGSLLSPLPLSLPTFFSSFFIGCSTRFHRARDVHACNRIHCDLLLHITHSNSKSCTQFFYNSLASFENIHTQKKRRSDTKENEKCFVYGVWRFAHTECMKAIFRVCAPAFQSDSELMFICFEVW